ncbi:MAG: lipoate--protein ligase family protein [Arcobacteraceae bacterium]
MQNSAIFRVIHTYNQSAVMNMAIDKALVLSFKKEDQPILRLYTWQNSFTVGVSQNTNTYEAYVKQYKANCAKRITGGGVLFHGHDLSYSLVLPTFYLENLSVKQSYEKICTFLLCFYKSLNLEARYAKDVSTINLSKSDFCQIGYEAYDIIINGKKIGGNAQKRTKNMIFQHGSIPLYTNNKNREMGISLEDLGVNISYKKAIEGLKYAFINTFNAKLEESNLNEKEHLNLEKILGKKYDTAEK